MTEDKIDNKIEDKEEDIKEKEEKISIADGECDPLTMNCQDMPDEMERLIRKEIILENKLESLDKLSEALPEESETLEKIEEKMNTEMEKVQDTIEKITTRFTLCRPPLNEEDEKNEK